MKQIFLPFVLLLALFASVISAGSEPSKTDAAEANLPKTPIELLEFLPGTIWRLRSGTGEYFSEGTLAFKGKGIVEHLYRDGELHKKRWGVTSDMKVIWGGKFMRVCRFSEDFKTFVDSRNETTGRRVKPHAASKADVTVKK